MYNRTKCVKREIITKVKNPNVKAQITNKIQNPKHLSPLAFRHLLLSACNTHLFQFPHEKRSLVARSAVDDELERFLQGRSGESLGKFHIQTFAFRVFELLSEIHTECLKLS